MRRWIIGLAASLMAVAGLVGIWVQQSAASDGVVFVIKVKKGTLVQNDIIVNPGVKVPVVKFKAKQLAECIRGEASDSFCTDFMQNDPDGIYYIYCDDRSTWRIGTNPDGLLTTELRGNVDPLGNFMMAGTDSLSGMRLFLVGKAKLVKGTFVPKKISGTGYYTSETIMEFGSAKFTSTGTVGP